MPPQHPRHTSHFPSLGDWTDGTQEPQGRATPEQGGGTAASPAGGLSRLTVVAAAVGVPGELRQKAEAGRRELRQEAEAGRRELRQEAAGAGRKPPPEEEAAQR